MSTRSAKAVYIEISGKCNASCPYCARYRFPDRYAGDNMNSGLFLKIIRHLKQENVIALGDEIGLINWGEPTLNPELSVILAHLRAEGLTAYISSNFIKNAWGGVSAEDLRAISSLTFSISGFSQKSYGKIHGAQIEKVLKHFNEFYERARRVAPTIKMNVVWHRYSFNEKEFWHAYKYFYRRKISFLPMVAWFNDLEDTVGYATGLVGGYDAPFLSQDRLSRAKDDLLFCEVKSSLKNGELQMQRQSCPQFDYIVIDEYGGLLPCCGFSAKHENAKLGQVLDMTGQEIWDSKNKFYQSSSFCKKCSQSGAPIMNSFLDKVPWPKYGDDFIWCMMYAPYGLLKFPRRVLGKVKRKIIGMLGEDK